MEVLEVLEDLEVLDEDLEDQEDWEVQELTLEDKEVLVDQEDLALVVLEEAFLDQEA